jgi:DNA-binding XRE family transcriptional regulator
MSPLTIDLSSLALKNVIDMGPVDKAQLAESIRTGRARLNLTRVQFAQAAGIATNTLRALENGTHRRLAGWATMEKIAKVLKIPTERLLAGKLPLQSDDPLLVGLNREDLTIARLFHDAILEVKLAIRLLLKAPCTEDHRERLAMLTQRLMRLEADVLEDLEHVMTGLDLNVAETEPKPSVGGKKRKGEKAR